jgi:hypothetical protein
VSARGKTLWFSVEDAVCAEVVYEPPNVEGKRRPQAGEASRRTSA